LLVKNIDYLRAEERQKIQRRNATAAARQAYTGTTTTGTTTSRLSSHVALRRPVAVKWHAPHDVAVLRSSTSKRLQRSLRYACLPRSRPLVDLSLGGQSS